MFGRVLGRVVNRTRAVAQLRDRTVFALLIVQARVQRFLQRSLRVPFFVESVRVGTSPVPNILLLECARSRPTRVPHLNFVVI